MAEEVRILYDISSAIVGKWGALYVIGNVKRASNIISPIVVSNIRTAYGENFSEIHIYKIAPPLGQWFYSYNTAIMAAGLSLSINGGETVSINPETLALGLKTGFSFTRMWAEISEATPLAVVHPNSDDLSDWRFTLDKQGENPEILVVYSDLISEARETSEEAQSERLEEIRDIPTYSHIFTSSKMFRAVQDDLVSYYRKYGMTLDQATLKAMKKLKQATVDAEAHRPLKLPEPIIALIDSRRGIIGRYLGKKVEKKFDQTRKKFRGLYESIYTPARKRRKQKEKIKQYNFKAAQGKVILPYTSSLHFTLTYTRA